MRRHLVRVHVQNSLGAALRVRTGALHRAFATLPCLLPQGLSDGLLEQRARNSLRARIDGRLILTVHLAIIIITTAFSSLVLEHLAKLELLVDLCHERIRLVLVEAHNARAPALAAAS